MMHFLIGQQIILTGFVFSDEEAKKKCSKHFFVDNGRTPPLTEK
jgi:hypothetical protein